MALCRDAIMVTMTSVMTSRRILLVDELFTSVDDRDRKDSEAGESGWESGRESGGDSGVTLLMTRCSSPALNSKHTACDAT